jgi:secondary thiamine-phosphate synthase enzyme
MVVTRKLTLESDGGFATFNLTETVRAFVTESGVRHGTVLVYYQHTTGAVMVIEHEAGFLVDLEDTLERLVPIVGDYKHHLCGYDENGAIHVRNALLNTSVHVPVLDGELLLGQYQDILALDMQMDRSPRTVILQVMGE